MQLIWLAVKKTILPGRNVCIQLQQTKAITTVGNNYVYFINFEAAADCRRPARWADFSVNTKQTQNLQVKYVRRLYKYNL